jgi:hypothetical protein
MSIKFTAMVDQAKINTLDCGYNAGSVLWWFTSHGANGNGQCNP